MYIKARILTFVDISRFANSPVGYLVDFKGTDPRSGDAYVHKAFVPEPLPDQVDLKRSTVNAIADAMHGLGRLDQALRWIANPMVFIRPAIRREAVNTSALEGTFAAFEDIMGVDMLDHAPVSASVAEVMNFVEAAEEATAWAKERPITRIVVCELQRVLVRGTQGDGPEAGQIRSTPVLIGPKGCTVEQARFVPPPPGDALIAGFADWEAWIERHDDIPLLARVAIGHYQFETLHPVTDGNGRIGRLLSVLQLMRAGVIQHPMLNISPWFYAHRDEYVDHLLNVSVSGSYDPWVQFFCQAIAAESGSAVDRIERAQHWRDSLIAKVREKHIKAAAVHQLANGMIGHPVVSPRWVQQCYGVSYPTANSAIQRLVDLQALREMTGRNYGRLFASTELLAIFNG